MDRLSRPSVSGRISAPPPIEPNRRAVAYGWFGLLSLALLAALYLLGPSIYNGLRMYSLGGRVVYATLLDPQRALAAAQAEAQRERRRLLVMIGTNACRFCLALDDLLKSDASIREELAQRFVLVRLDAAQARAFDAAWGRPLKFALPVLVFFDAAGRVAHVQETASLALWAGRVLAHDSAKILQLLRAYG
jgi:hypothetical protein